MSAATGVTTIAGLAADKTPAPQLRNPVREMLEQPATFHRLAGPTVEFQGQKWAIRVQYFLTDNILIPNGFDGYGCNAYGDFWAFCGEVTYIPESANLLDCMILRLETEPKTLADWAKWDNRPDNYFMEFARTGISNAKKIGDPPSKMNIVTHKTI